MLGARCPWVDMVDMSFWGTFRARLYVGQRQFGGKCFMALFREDQQYLGFISLLSWNIKVKSWKLKVESWKLKVESWNIKL